MALTAVGFVNEAAIDSAVRRVERTFSSEVVRIGHSFKENSNGDSSIFFRILVQDDVATPIRRLYDFAQQISIALMNEVRTDENGLHAYFNFRTVSEQHTLQDPDWA